MDNIRNFLATPFYLLAKLFGAIASAVDGQDVLVVSMRDCIELTDETMEEIFKELDNE